MPDGLLHAAVLGGIPHGFFGGTGADRASEASEGEVPTADDRALARVATRPGAQLVMLRQVHSSRAVVVEAPFAEDARPEADAMVTDRAGLALGIVTADCAPILLADPVASIIGAAHAGWRGAQGGVLEATVHAMENLGSRRKDIVAAIGPCIAQASYEVGEDMKSCFDSAADRFFAPGRASKWQFDLPGYVADRLESCEVGAVQVLGIDTYTNEPGFFSYRRSVHRREPNGGRQLSIIGLV